jgi:outer membrane protein
VRDAHNRVLHGTGVWVLALFRTVFPAVMLASAALFAAAPVQAETIAGALAKAYENNASLNSERAGVRVTDEGVAIARSGYRPVISGSSSLNFQNQSGMQIRSGSFGVSIQQSLFDGFQTTNNVRAAESRVFASQEALRNAEQNILFNAAAAYMDVIRDRQIAAFTERNLEFLAEQVRSANSRLEVGEGTRTDVAQAQASSAAAQAQLSAARAQAAASAATYRQIFGEDPGRLEGASAITRLLPGSLESAYATAAAQHPAILATQHLVDAAGFTVKATEGTLLPQVSAQGSISRNYSDGGTNPGTSNSASIGLNLTVPIYQGGRASAQVRQSKESLGQARIEVDVSRDQVRQAVASAWAQYVAAQQLVVANRQVVSAAQLALSGVNEERTVGQRTTLDVLNAQADVINAQINVASAERDVVVASYAIVSAMGRLSASTLGLAVAVHRPEEHYDAVKDKWFGLRTPDGR